MPKYNDKDKYDEIVTLMKDITQCRNKVHRGAAQFDWQREILNRVLPLKSLYYFKFLGALAQFVEFVKSGITFLPRIKLYTDTLTPKIVPEPAISLKFTGEKVQLSEKDRNKKRFK